MTRDEFRTALSNLSDYIDGDRVTREDDAAILALHVLDFYVTDHMVPTDFPRCLQQGGNMPSAS
jgi:hypothetical protein